MPTRLDKRPGSHEDRVYDDNFDSSPEALHKMMEAEASPEQVAEEERNRLAGQEADQTANAGSSTGTSGVSSDDLSQAEQTADDQVGKGYSPQGTPQKGGRGFRGLVRKAGSRRNMLLSAGTVGFIVIMFLMWSGFSVFELINLRENLLGFNNRFANHVLHRRRASSFAKILNDLHEGNLTQDVDHLKFKEAFERQGFTIKFGEDGKLKEFSFIDSTGEKRPFDLTGKDPVKATTEFFSGEGFGREASKAYDGVLNGRGITWGSAAAKKANFLARLVFYDWLDKKSPNEDKAKGPKELLNDKLRHAYDEPSTTASGLKSASQLEDENSTKDANGNTQRPSVLDTAEQMMGGADAYRDDLLNNPAAGDETIGVGSVNDVDGFARAVSDAASSGVNEGALRNIASEYAQRIPGRILPVLGKATAKSLSILGVGQFACEIKGTLNFVANVRNVMLSIEMVKFAALWLTAADNQKAGILTAEGLNLAMIYLHTPSPNGTYWGVLQSGRVTKADQSRLGMGRNNGGVLGKASTFVNGIPGAGSCKIIQNGFVAIAGFAVGIVAAIGSGGTEFAGQLAIGLTLALVQEMIFQIATPLLIKAGTHMLFNGFENSTTIGAGILGGFSQYASMNAGAHGLRPSTKKDVKNMSVAIANEERMALRDQSLYDRYLNPENGTSLMARIGMSMPKGFWGLQASISSGGLGLFNRMSNFGVMNFLVPGSARAAAAGLDGDEECTDPQILRYGIAANSLCVPIMANSPDLSLDLDQTQSILRQYNLINDDGTPTDQDPPSGGLSFTKFADTCFGARPGSTLFYKADPNKDGSDDPEDDTCVISGSKLPGDSVGVYERYSHWWGFNDDTEGILGNIDPTREQQ